MQFSFHDCTAVKVICSLKTTYYDPLDFCAMHCALFSTLVEMNKRLVTYGQFGILYDFIIPPI